MAPLQALLLCVAAVAARAEVEGLDVREPESTRKDVRLDFILDTATPLPPLAEAPVRGVIPTGVCASSPQHPHEVALAWSRAATAAGASIVHRPWRGRAPAPGQMELNDTVARAQFEAAWDRLTSLPPHTGISVDLLCEVHRVAMAGDERAGPGMLRSVQVRAGDARFAPLPQVPRLLKAMIDRLSVQPTGTSPFSTAAFIVAALLAIHPFRDGNGRVALLFGNHALRASGVPVRFVPTSHSQEEWDRYITALRAVQFADTAREQHEGLAALSRLVLDSTLLELAHHTPQFADTAGTATCTTPIQRQHRAAAAAMRLRRQRGSSSDDDDRPTGPTVTNAPFTPAPTECSVYLGGGFRLVAPTAATSYHTQRSNDPTYVNFFTRRLSTTAYVTPLSLVYGGATGSHVARPFSAITAAGGFVGSTALAQTVPVDQAYGISYSDNRLSYGTVQISIEMTRAATLRWRFYSSLCGVVSSRTVTRNGIAVATYANTPVAGCTTNSCGADMAAAVGDRFSFNMHKLASGGCWGELHVTVEVVSAQGPCTSAPTRNPTQPPTRAPTRVPTRNPTQPPTRLPTTASPTRNPTQPPTRAPTRVPTRNPTQPPTRLPTTASPTRTPTQPPTRAPTTASPTRTPTQPPTRAPTTASPTRTPTQPPTRAPTTASPTRTPTQPPTRAPTRVPILAPTAVAATRLPTQSPTRVPTQPPTRTPTTVAPTQTPTRTPTQPPSRVPTLAPTPPPAPGQTTPPTTVPTPPPSASPTPAPTRPPTRVPTRVPTRTRISFTTVPSASLTASPTAASLAPTSTPVASSSPTHSFAATPTERSVQALTTPPSTHNASSANPPPAEVPTPILATNQTTAPSTTVPIVPPSAGASGTSSSDESGASMWMIAVVVLVVLLLCCGCCMAAMAVKRKSSSPKMLDPALASQYTTPMVANPTYAPLDPPRTAVAHSNPQYDERPGTGSDIYQIENGSHHDSTRTLGTAANVPSQYCSPQDPGVYHTVEENQNSDGIAPDAAGQYATLTTSAASATVCQTYSTLNRDAGAASESQYSTLALGTTERNRTASAKYDTLHAARSLADGDANHESLKIDVSEYITVGGAKDTAGGSVETVVVQGYTIPLEIGGGKSNAESAL